LISTDAGDSGDQKLTSTTTDIERSTTSARSDCSSPTAMT